APPEHVGRFFAPARIEKQARLHFERLRFKAASTKLVGELAREIALHGLEVAKFIGGEHAHIFAKQFSTWLPDELGSAGGRITILPRLLRLIQIDAAKANHRSIGHFDLAETVLAAQRNATAKVFERAAHPSLRLTRICQAAKTTRLGFGGIQAASIDKATFVFVFAAIDVPKREINIAAEMMDASEFTRELVFLGGFLGLIHQIQRVIQTLADPKALGQ